MSAKPYVGPLRPPRRRERMLDTEPLFRPGALVEVALDVGDGRVERWRGEVVRAASGERRSVELCPFGCSNTIEFPLEDVRESYVDDVRPGSPVYQAIARNQAMRIYRGGKLR